MDENGQFPLKDKRYKLTEWTRTVSFRSKDNRYKLTEWTRTVSFRSKDNRYKLTEWTRTVSFRSKDNRYKLTEWTSTVSFRSKDNRYKLTEWTSTCRTVSFCKCLWNSNKLFKAKRNECRGPLCFLCSDNHWRNCRSIPAPLRSAFSPIRMQIHV